MSSRAHDGTRERAKSPERLLRPLLVLLLAACAALTLAGLPSVRARVASGAWPRSVLAVPPALLGLFIVGYAAYRLRLVRSGRYPAGKVLAQVGLMLLALGIFAGITCDTGPVERGPGRIERGLRSGDPEVRALSAELARYRPGGASLVPRLIELLDDKDPEVRREAHESLVALTGRDLGEGVGAGKRWRAATGRVGPLRGGEVSR